MTGGDMKTLFWDLYRQKSTNTSIGDAPLTRFLSLGYKRVVSDLFVDNLDTETSISVPVTTLVSRTSATVWVVTSGTGFSNGQLVCFFQGSRFDVIRLKASGGVVTNTLTFDSPGIPYTYTAGAFVTPVEFTTSAFREIRSAYYQIYSATDTTVTRMVPVSDEDMWVLGANPSSYGAPSKYAIMSPTVIRIPLPAETSGYIKLRYKNKTEYSVGLTGADTDEPIIDEDLHLAIVFFALGLAAYRDRDPESLKFWTAAYQYVLQTYKAELSNKMSANVEFGLEPESLD